MLWKTVSLIVLFVISTSVLSQETIRTDTARINFVSDATLELVKASSKKCKGVLNMRDGSFMFVVRINSFEGFNSALQREHFNENYMESSKHPFASFKGRMLQMPDFSKNGTQTIQVKGFLNVHGVESLRVLDVRLSMSKSTTVSFSCEFEVMLRDHDIRVPRLVEEKISRSIEVSVDGSLQ